MVSARTPTSSRRTAPNEPDKLKILDSHTVRARLRSSGGLLFLVGEMFASFVGAVAKGRCRNRLRQLQTSLATDPEDRCVRQKCNKQQQRKLLRIALAVDFQLLDNVLRVEAVGNELRAFARQGSQKPFSTLVDKRNVIQINSAAPPRPCRKHPLPGYSKFVDPRPYQASFKNPLAFRWRLRDRDFQHVRFFPLQ